MSLNSLVSWLAGIIFVFVGWCPTEVLAVTANPSVITFQAVQGAGNPPSQTVSLSKQNRRPTTWVATESAAWLSLSPGTGAMRSSAQVSLAVNTAGLAAGTYNATITINVDKDGSASVPVILTVAPPAGSGSSATAKSVTSNTTATLTWSPVTSTNLAGYKVYFGMASGRYGSPVDVGNVTSYVLNNLTLGNTYYFTVTSYNGSGVESAFSNEVSKSIY
jgi:hypothetical protein